MKIVFNNTDAMFNVWSTHFDKTPYERPVYWSMVFNRLRFKDETNDTFFKRLNEEWGIKVLSDSSTDMMSGITGVELEESMLTAVLMKFPAK